jgi:signal transduction histidine kinase/CheY-like chemotaxis protein
MRGEPYDIEHRLLVNGRVKWVREKAYLEFDNEGRPQGGFGITQDISRRKQLEEDLRRSRDELELRVKERTNRLSLAVKKLNQRSSQLRKLTEDLTLAEHRERQRLAQVLHDGLQQMLVAANFQIELINHAQKYPKELNQLKKVLNEAIEISRSLAVELSPPILLRRNLNDALEWLAHSMLEKYGFEVTLKPDGSLQSLSESEFLLLFQSARELLFNVVKHAGVRKASIEWTQREGRALMTVEDEGAGFDPASLTSDLGEWKGVGLFRIHERILSIGGRMEIDSSPGRGSRFRLTVPLSTEIKKTEKITALEQVPFEADGRASNPESQKSDAGIKIRIVLVDDHEVVRQGVADLLNKEPDFEIAGEACDGASAVNLVREIRPDVVLMDINMPGMDGIQVTRTICKEFSGISVIGFSIGEEAEERAILEAGAVAYFPKSRSSNDLIKVIRSCVRPEN